MVNIELGCGLIAIGREWGSTPEIPSEKAAVEFLSFAYESGVRFFDTAASYGFSEQRLGKFLRTLTDSERNEVTIATKFGEHWDFESNKGYADYSYDALVRSLDNSIKHLGHIGLLQLHRATPELIHDQDVLRAFAYAQEQGIPKLGVSGNGVEVLEAALADDNYSAIQMPFNAAWPDLRPFLKSPDDGGKFVLINRPLQEGRAAQGTTGTKQDRLTAAYSFILENDFEGVVLSGTSNTQHLRENIDAFNAAKSGMNPAD